MDLRAQIYESSSPLYVLVRLFSLCRLTGRKQTQLMALIKGTGHVLTEFIFLSNHWCCQRYRWLSMSRCIWKVIFNDFENKKNLTCWKQAHPKEMHHQWEPLWPEVDQIPKLVPRRNCFRTPCWKKSWNWSQVVICEQVRKVYNVCQKLWLRTVFCLFVSWFATVS